MVDDQSVAPSSHARPGLKWTGQLHERFLEVVSRLGGASSKCPSWFSALRWVPAITVGVCLFECRGDAQVGGEVDGRLWPHPLPAEDPVAGTFRLPPQSPMKIGRRRLVLYASPIAEVQARREAQFRSLQPWYGRRRWWWRRELPRKPEGPPSSHGVAEEI